MALHKDFPTDPYAILDPSIRWFPADEDLRDKGHEKLLPPLVDELRKKAYSRATIHYKDKSINLTDVL